MGVFMLVAFPVVFIALLAWFLIATVIKGEKERNNN